MVMGQNLYTAQWTVQWVWNGPVTANPLNPLQVGENAWLACFAHFGRTLPELRLVGRWSIGFGWRWLGDSIGVPCSGECAPEPLDVGSAEPQQFALCGRVPWDHEIQRAVGIQQLWLLGLGIFSQGLGRNHQFPTTEISKPTASTAVGPWPADDFSFPPTATQWSRGPLGVGCFELQRLLALVGSGIDAWAPRTDRAKTSSIGGSGCSSSRAVQWSLSG